MTRAFCQIEIAKRAVCRTVQPLLAASLVGEAPEQIERALANIRIGDLGECCHQLDTLACRQKSPQDIRRHVFLAGYWSPTRYVLEKICD